jgi:hypothetical protein
MESKKRPTKRVKRHSKMMSYVVFYRKPIYVSSLRQHEFIYVPSHHFLICDIKTPFLEEKLFWSKFILDSLYGQTGLPKGEFSASGVKEDEHFGRFSFHIEFNGIDAGGLLWANDDDVRVTFEFHENCFVLELAQ